jgi:hypothetical protein
VRLQVANANAQAARSASAKDGASSPVTFAQSAGFKTPIPDIAAQFRDDQQNRNFLRPREWAVSSAKPGTGFG